MFFAGRPRSACWSPDMNLPNFVRGCFNGALDKSFVKDGARLAP